MERKGTMNKSLKSTLLSFALIGVMGTPMAAHAIDDPRTECVIYERFILSPYIDQVSPETREWIYDQYMTYCDWDYPRR
jgi:hypothetical protein